MVYFIFMRFFSQYKAIAIRCPRVGRLMVQGTRNGECPVLHGTRSLTSVRLDLVLVLGNISLLAPGA